MKDLSERKELEGLNFNLLNSGSLQMFASTRIVVESKLPGKVKMM